MTNQNKGINFINLIPSILMMVMAFVVIYWVATGIYAILSYISIGLFAATAIINYKVLLDYGKMLFNLLQRNPLMGLVGIGLTFFLYPLVALFLFGKAMLLRKVGQMQKRFENRQQGEFVEYEEVDDAHPERPQIFELPPLQEKPKQKPKQDPRNDYEDLFE